jgi:trehalose 6-phosphate phosphatase
VKAARGILLLLDFDGTLSPIVEDPGDAVLPAAVRKWLRSIARRKNIRLGIVTGRSLDDMMKRAGLRNLIIAANHGMEIYRDGRALLRKGKGYRKPIAQLAGRLSKALGGIPGVGVEDKGLSVVVHFRKVPPRMRGEVKKIARSTARPWLKRHNLQLTGGKMILEVRPALIWNKGRAVLWIWRHLAPSWVPIYVGDDTTDEDAFAALRPYGLTIRIGRKRETHAEYYVPSIKTIINSRLLAGID